MAIELISKIKPKNNGTFPMVDAEDVEMPDGTRLSQFKGGVTSVNGQTGDVKITVTDGKDGYTPVKGVDYFDGEDGKDGSNGKDGANGKDGVSPSVSVTAITGGHRVSITDAKGTKTFDVMDGEDGNSASITVDSDFSETSENPVQNKVITAALNDATQVLGELYEAIENLEGGGSCPTGTIDVPYEAVVEWNTTVTPTVTLDVSAFEYTGYKVSDVMLTKDQILNANWNRGITEYGVDVNDAPNASDILVDTDDMLVFQFATAPAFGFVFAYKTGNIPISLYGYDLELTVEETGMYFLWEYGQPLITGAYGSIAYTGIETQEVNFVQANWEQSDVTAPDYIKNKPSITGLPDVTTDDNGKILQVENGVWTAVTVANSPIKTYVDEYISSALGGEY